MTFRLRLVGTLWLATLLVIAGFAFRQVIEERERLTQDLERRATLLGEGLQEAAAPALAGASRPRIERLVNKFRAADQGVAVYLERSFQHREIWPFYRHADFCMVTSLHDGMNLVAKEFISTRDGDGALILSQFTGAASELRDALLVNPYDLDGMAEAIRDALEMPVDERRARMARMQQLVREQNVYRWAGLLLSELSRIPGPALGSAPSPVPAATSGSRTGSGSEGVHA